MKLFLPVSIVSLVLSAAITHATPKKLAPDEQYVCKVANAYSPFDYLINETITAPSLDTRVVFHSAIDLYQPPGESEDAKRTLNVSLEVMRTGHNILYVAFRVDDQNGSKDRSDWIMGPSVLMKMQKTTWLNLNGRIDLENNGIVFVNYNFECALKK